MTTPSTSYTSWQEWFDSRDSATTINKAHQAALFRTFDAEVESDKITEELIQHEETTFLFKVNFGEANINIFHHLKKIGGTIYQPNVSYGFIQGTGTTTTWTMTPDTSILTENPAGDAVPTPTPTNLNGITTIENATDIEISATITYKPRNFIPIPPFLLEPLQKVIVDHNGDAKQALVQCAKAITAFDTTHTDDDDYIDRARTNCKDILLWLYLVSVGSPAIKATSVIGCNSAIVATQFKELTEKVLGTKTVSAQDEAATVGDTLKRPFEVLATSASTTAEFVEKLTQLQKQSNEKSTKSFSKIPAKYQNMILVATSTGEATNVNYEQDAANFFKATNLLHAQVLLNSEMETARIDCTVSPAMATMLYHGGFLWSSPLTPSGFAASTIVSEGVLRTDTLYEGMVLDYSTKHDMSTASLAKLTKTQIMFPTTIENTIDRIQALKTLSTYFFGIRSFISQGLTKLVNSCMDNRQLLRTKLYMDQQFIAKFIYAVDDRIYQWLRQCSAADAVTDTDLELVDFGSLFKDILLSRFDITLPPNISKVKNIEKPSDAENKKLRASPVMVRNHKQINEWKVRSSERWDTVFRAKSRHGPTLSIGGKPCLKYHVKGFCFEDCGLAESHMELNDEDRELTANFIKELRGE
jgi:hypothetical protein